jgi:hypothetical protein
MQDAAKVSFEPKVTDAAAGPEDQIGHQADFRCGPNINLLGRAK